MTSPEWVERRRRYINILTKQTSLDYCDVLPTHLSINYGYACDKEHKDSSYRWQWGQRMSDETLFEFIEIAPDPPIITKNELPRRGSVSIDDLLDAIKSCIITHWDPGQFHIVMHSSGYDSRLLSALLLQLGLTTNLLFVCTKVEGPAFKRIMEFEGWPESSYMVYNESVPLDEYFSDAIEDFHGAHIRLGGVARLPANFFWYTVSGLQRLGLCPEDSKVDLWHSQYSDTMLSTLGSGGVKKLHKVWSDFRYHNIRSRPFKCAREFSPWLNLNVIKAVGGLGKGVVSATALDAPEFKIKLCERVMEGLGEFKNVHGWGDERLRISKRLATIADDLFSASWYGKEMWSSPTLPTSTQFSNYWEHWTSASLCDHLLREGYDISC